MYGYWITPDRLQMPCRLCLQEKRIRRSHIIPEFLYEALYDDKHRFKIINIENPSENRINQKGLRDELLCDDCESLFSNYERYVSLVFRGEIKTECVPKGRMRHISGLDYAAFKLFSHSLLWRASVSNLPFFKEVNLGKHEEVLRASLLAEDPGSASYYPLLITGILFGKEPAFEIILEPTRSRMNGHNCYRFVCGGLVWVFVVSSHKVTGVFTQAMLNEQGRFTMLIQPVKDVSFLARQLERIEEKWLEF